MTMHDDSVSYLLNALRSVATLRQLRCVSSQPGLAELGRLEGHILKAFYRTEEDDAFLPPVQEQTNFIETIARCLDYLEGAARMNNHPAVGEELARCARRLGSLHG